MKKIQLFLIVLGTLVATTSFSQTTRLNELNRFNKIVLKGDVSGIDVSRSHHDDLSLFIEGAKNEDVTASIQAGVLYLTLRDADNALVHVFNNELKRIECDSDIEVSGVEYIGSNGRYLITRFDNGHHHSFSHNRRRDFNLNFDRNFDIDLDIDLDELKDLDLNVSVDIDDHDWEWEWDWNWNWEDHRNEFRSHSKEFKEELKESLKDVKEDFKDLKKDLKKL